MTVTLNAEDGVIVHVCVARGDEERVLDARIEPKDQGYTYVCGFCWESRSWQLYDDEWTERA